MAKLVTLPTAPELKELLERADDNAHRRENLHPLLIKYAGQQKTTSGVVLMLMLALNDYAVPLGPAMVEQVLAIAPKYIGYLIVYDRDALAEAEACLAQSLAAGA
jgi:hypothetical protein